LIDAPSIKAPCLSCSAGVDACKGFPMAYGQIHSAMIAEVQVSGRAPPTSPHNVADWGKIKPQGKNARFLG